MINIEFTPTVDEAAQATFDFLSNRPIMSFMLKIMKVSCVLLAIGFVITAIGKSIRVQDIAALIMALVWLIFYKRINHWLIKRNLRLRKFDVFKQSLSIDSRAITATTANNFMHKVEWKSVKFVLKNAKGYIVPLTGFSNAGKFFWIPFSSLDASTNKELESVLEQAKIKVKSI